MYCSFGDCPKLAAITWPVEPDTSKMTTMAAIFEGCSGLGASTAAGAEKWTTYLNAGMSVRAVAAGFSQSTEHNAHFAKTGLNASAIGVTEARDVNINFACFANRLYSKVLNRNFDVAGMNHWCEILLSGASAADVAWGFFGSQEFASFGYDGPTTVTKC